MILLLSIALIMACGCATSHQETNSLLSNLRSPASIITLSRPKQFVGSGLPFKIYDDTNYIGQLGPGGELRWKRPPEFVTLSCKVDTMGQKESSYAQFYSLPNMEYAFTVNVIMTNFLDHRIIWKALSNKVVSADVGAGDN